MALASVFCGYKTRMTTNNLKKFSKDFVRKTSTKLHWQVYDFLTPTGYPIKFRH